MSEDYILQEVNRSKEVVFPEKIILDISNFKSVREKSSIDSVLLVLGGHRPEEEVYFDYNKLIAFCKKNNLDFFKCEKSRLFHFKKRSLGRLKVLRCSNSSFWYKDFVGECFDIEGTSFNSYNVKREYEGYWFIRGIDVEIIN